MAEEGNGTNVVYSVKDLLAKLEGKVDAVLIAVATKVDRSEFDQLRRDVDDLRQNQRVVRSVSDYGRWLWTAGAPVSAALLTYFLTH